MKLVTKLLLGIGVLLLVMVVVMYLFPIIFIGRDVDIATRKIQKLLQEEHQKLLEGRRVSLKNAIERVQINVNTFLSTIYRRKELLEELAFSPTNPLINSWNALSRISSYSADVGFIQLHSPKERKTAVIIPHETHFFPVFDLYKEEGWSLIISLIHPSSTRPQDHVYVGIPSPQGLHPGTPGYTLYALIKPESIEEQIAAVKEKLAALSMEIIESRIEEIKQFGERPQDELLEALGRQDIKIRMIQELTPLYVDGLVFNAPNGEKADVEGLARILDATEDGFAILSDEVFKTEPLFNDTVYFERHPPNTLSPPLASGTALITNVEERHVYLGNTLLFDSTFLTIASSLGPLTKQLALAASRGIIVHVKGGFWFGFNANGEKFSQEEMDQIEKTELREQEEGVISIGKTDYHFALFGTFAEGRLVFYSFHSMEERMAVHETLLGFEDTLFRRISFQLSLISLALVILILFFTTRLGLSIVYPIMKLAQATKDVASGQFEDVSLPSVGKRKDEIAILTHSFDDMVKGLSEREKIRGVLDKVVSKEVAEEILKEQIHLGGEDRVVSMLFSDIRGFTKLTRDLPPQITIQMLNDCMTKISRIIESEGGVIDKYVGDEVMAIYGAPVFHPDHALRAVSSGMFIIETLRKWNQERKERGEHPIEMGVGINTGLVVAGNMGAENRLNYTVLGANVNLAARLCHVAKPDQLIISKNTLSEPNIKQSFHVRSLSPITLKGFAEAVQIFEVTGFKWEGEE